MSGAGGGQTELPGGRQVSGTCGNMHRDFVRYRRGLRACEESSPQPVAGFNKPQRHGRLHELMVFLLVAFRTECAGLNAAHEAELLTAMEAFV